MFTAVSASGIMHALSNMKHKEQNGNFHPPRHLQQSQNQMQVRNMRWNNYEQWWNRNGRMKQTEIITVRLYSRIRIFKIFHHLAEMDSARVLFQINKEVNHICHQEVPLVTILEIGCLNHYSNKVQCIQIQV